MAHEVTVSSRHSVPAVGRLVDKRGVQVDQSFDRNIEWWVVDKVGYFTLVDACFGVTLKELVVELAVRLHVFDIDIHIHP